MTPRSECLWSVARRSAARSASTVGHDPDGERGRAHPISPAKLRPSARAGRGQPREQAVDRRHNARRVEDAHKGGQAIVLHTVPPSVVTAALLPKSQALCKSTGEARRRHDADNDEREDDWPTTAYGSQTPETSVI
jgi:hypothetical protein